MDWTKAKNLLIVALVVTNLVLIFTYQFKDDSSKNYDNEALISYLNSKNIVVETEIPQKKCRMQALSVKYEKPDEKLIKKVIKNQKSALNKDVNNKEQSTSADKALVHMTDGFLEECRVMTDSVEFDKVIREKGVTKVVYKNIFEGIPIEDSYMTCTIEKGKVIAFDRYWLEPIKDRKPKKEVISASAALMKFMSEKEGKDKIHVESIELIYWLDRSDFNTSSSVGDTARPTWKITYDHGKTKHILA